MTQATKGLYLDASLVGGPEMLGMVGTAGLGSRAAGEALPPTTSHPHAGSDAPWSPDSGMFWLIVITIATITGITGASAKVRVFRGRAEAQVGET